MADDDELLVGRLQRELGLVAARAEQGRLRAEEALEVERKKNAELARAAQESADQLAALQSEAAGLRLELATAQESVAEAAAAAAAARAVQHTAPEPPELPALRTEVARLRAELSQAQSALAEARAASAAAPGEAEVTNLRKELRGMSVVVSTLEKKLSTYEHRLMEQATTCAEEINDLKCRLSNILASNANSPGGRVFEAEFDDDLSDLRITESTGLGIGGLGFGGLGLGTNGSGNSGFSYSASDNYFRLGADAEEGISNASAGGSSLLAGMAKWSVPVGFGFSGSNNGALNGNRPEAQQSSGGYQPPKLPDAI